MNKSIGIGLVIIVLTVAVVFGLAYYSYTQIHVSLNDVTYHSIDWAPITWPMLIKSGLDVLTGNWLAAAFDLIEGINLNLVFEVSNNGFLPVYIPDISYDLSVNGVPVGKGSSDASKTINPGQAIQIDALQNLKKSHLAPAINSIVSAGGVIDLKVSGIAYFKLFGMDIPVPFESSKKVSIEHEIKKQLEIEIKKNQQEQTDIFESLIKESFDSFVESVKDFFGTD